MKKIILGLFLTVGVSGFALAGNVNIPTTTTTTDTTITSDSIAEVTDTDCVNSDLLKLNCATSYFVKSKNCDGTVDLIASGYYSHDCGAGQPEGELTISITWTTGEPVCG